MVQAVDQPIGGLWACPDCDEIFELLGGPRAPECRACGAELERFDDQVDALRTDVPTIAKVKRPRRRRKVGHPLPLRDQWAPRRPPTVFLQLDPQSPPRERIAHDFAERAFRDAYPDVDFTATVHLVDPADAVAPRSVIGNTPGAVIIG